MSLLSEIPTLSRTPLYPCHQELHAKFTSFGGWEMPVQYSGVTEEHLAVRNEVGLFDVSHMGEIIVDGPKALAFLQRVTSNNVEVLKIGRAQYSLLLNTTGGVVDDIIIYRLAPESYLLCVNASNTNKDYLWLSNHNDENAKIENRSNEFSQVAIQGPRAEEVLCNALGVHDNLLSATNLTSFSVTEYVPSGGRLNGVKLVVARTGYTGEDGFEIFCLNHAGPMLWRLLIDVGKPYGLKPVGLAARDTLRLEACYPLHGHELRDDVSALQSGVGKYIKFDKPAFIGKDALLRLKEGGISRKLVGVEVTGRGIVREGVSLFSGKEVGVVTSGTKTPSISKPVGLAFVDVDRCEVGTELEADIRGKRVSVVVCKIPFYVRAKKYGSTS